MVLPAETTTLQLSPLQARAVANRFVLENLPDRFSAGEPRVLTFPVRTVWIIPMSFDRQIGSATDANVEHAPEQGQLSGGGNGRGILSPVPLEKT